MAALERIVLPSATGKAFAGGSVAPSQFLVSGEESLLVRFTLTLSAAVGGPTPISLTIREVLVDGSIQVSSYLVPWDQVSSSGQLLIPLAAGAITNVAARYASGQYPDGVLYCSVYIVRGQNANAFAFTGQLLGGYLTLGKSLAWQGSPVVGWNEAPGLFKPAILGNVALGAELNFQVTIPAVWRLIAFAGTFACSAVVGTRFPAIGVKDAGGNLVYRTPLLTTLAASQSGEFNWALGYGSAMVGVPPRYFGPLTDLGPLPQLFRIVTSTTGIQAGDQWSSITVWVEERVFPIDL